MHHGQTRGDERRIKYAKTRKFYEISWKFAKVWGNNNFPETEGGYGNSENRGETKNLQSRTKNGH